MHKESICLNIGKIRSYSLLSLLIGTLLLGCGGGSDAGNDTNTESNTGGSNSGGGNQVVISDLTNVPQEELLIFEIDTTAAPAPITWLYSQDGSLIEDYADINLREITLTTWDSHNYHFDIEWGDGEFDNDVTGNISHTFPQPGKYTIKIHGSYPRPKFEGLRLQNLIQWGNIEYLSFNQAFYKSTGVITANDSPHISQVTDFSKMFEYGTNIESDIGTWDVSQVTNMQKMFRYTSFNQDISDWNVSNVIDMSGMFANTQFNQDIGDWDVSNVTDMNHMFYESVAFDQDVSSWDVSNVVDMSSMFENSGFEQNIGEWDVSSVTNMRRMFRAADHFNQDISSWDVSQVTNMSEMFAGIGIYCFQEVACREEQGLFRFNQDIGNWDVSNVTDMSEMFMAASLFNQNLNSWDVSSVTDMSHMFEHAQRFNGEIGHWDLANVISLRGMFSGAPSRNVYTLPFHLDGEMQFDQDIGGWNISKVTDLHGMFSEVTLSTANYDSLLMLWSAQELQPNLEFDAGFSQYSVNAVSARTSLISSHQWSILDGGLQE